MNKQTFVKLAKETKTILAKNSPVILTGFGIAGMTTTTVLAVKATPKALTLIEEKKEELEVETLTPMETVKTTWKCYVPAVVTCVVSTGCLIGATHVSTRRTAAIATAYKISETALAEYQEKVIETIGEKKEQTVRDKVHQEHLAKNPIASNDVIVTGKGETRCYDHHSGRYFTSSVNAIQRAANVINAELLRHDYVPLNRLYDELGMEWTTLGDELGWSVTDGLVEISFGAYLASDNEPCLAIEYNIAPKYDYSKFS